MALTDDLLRLAETGDPGKLVPTSYVRVVWRPHGPDTAVTYAVLPALVDVPLDPASDHAVRVRYGTATNDRGETQLAVVVTPLPGTDTRPFTDVRVEVYLGLRDPGDTSDEYTFYVFGCDSTPLVAAGAARRIGAPARALPPSLTLRGLPSPAEGSVAVAVGADAEGAASPVAVEYGYVRATVRKEAAFDGASVAVVDVPSVRYAVPVALAAVDGGSLSGRLFDASVTIATDPAPDAPAVRATGAGGASGSYTYRAAYVFGTRQGPAGPASAVVRTTGGAQVTATVDPDVPGVTGVRFFRSSAADPYHWYWCGETAAGKPVVEEGIPDDELSVPFATPRRASLEVRLGTRALHVEPRVEGTGLATTYTRLGTATGRIALDYADPPPPPLEQTVRIDTSGGSVAIVESAALGLGAGDFDAMLMSLAGLPDHLGVTLHLTPAERRFVEVRTAPPLSPAEAALGGLQVVLARRDPVDLQHPRHAVVVEQADGYLRVACTGLRHAAFGSGAPHRQPGPAGYAGDRGGQWVELLQSSATDYGRPDGDDRVTPRSLRFQIRGEAPVDVRAVALDPVDPRVPVLLDQRADDDTVPAAERVSFGLLLLNAVARGIRVRAETPRAALDLAGADQTLVAHVREATAPLRVALSPAEPATRRELVVKTAAAAHVSVDLTAYKVLAVERVAGRFDVSGSPGTLSFGDGVHELLSSDASISGRLAITSGFRSAPVLATTENQQVRATRLGHGIRLYGLRSLRLDTNARTVTVTAAGRRPFRYASDDGPNVMRVVVPSVPETVTVALPPGRIDLTTGTGATGGWVYVTGPVDLDAGLPWSPRYGGQSLVALDIEQLPGTVSVWTARDIGPPPGMFAVSGPDYRFSAVHLSANGTASARRLLIAALGRQFGHGQQFIGGGIPFGPISEDEWSLAAVAFVTVANGAEERTLGMWSAEETWDNPRRNVGAALATRGGVVSADVDSYTALIDAKDSPGFTVATAPWKKAAEVQLEDFAGWWRVGPGDTFASADDAGFWFLRAVQPAALAFNVAFDAYFGNTKKRRIYP
ncbi:MAG TPA: hypothetical protein VF519_02100 [Mycobacteriales bacterium]|jgi:hypothetical protein